MWTLRSQNGKMPTMFSKRGQKKMQALLELRKKRDLPEGRKRGKVKSCTFSQLQNSRILEHQDLATLQGHKSCQ